MPVVKITIQTEPGDIDESPRVFKMSLPHSMYRNSSNGYYKGEDWLAPFISHIKDFLSGPYTY